MYTFTKDITGSLFLTILALLATPFLTWIVWEFSKKKTSFFKEFSWEKLQTRLEKIGREPYNYLFEPFYHYSILFLCHVYYVFHRTPPFGSSVLTLSIIFSVIESPFSPIARTFFNFYIFHIVSLFISLHVMEGQRDAVYERFGKPNIDKLVGNSPLKEAIVTVGVAGSLALVGAYGAAHENAEATRDAADKNAEAIKDAADKNAEAIKDAAREDANARRYVADREAETSRLGGNREFTFRLLTSPEVPSSTKDSAFDDLREESTSLRRSLDHGFAAQAVFNQSDPVEEVEEVEEGQNEKKGENGKKHD